MSRHARWIARTVMVDLQYSDRDLPCEAASRMLDYKLNRENIIQTTKRNRYYEKQWMKRKRIAYNEVKKIYAAEMERKVAFLERTNRKNPWRVWVDWLKRKKLRLWKLKPLLGFVKIRNYYSMIDVFTKLVLIIESECWFNLNTCSFVT